MTTPSQWPDALTEQRRESLIHLIYQKTENNSEREQWLAEIETAGESDVMEIESLLNP